jgi:hypothetical protein
MSESKAPLRLTGILRLSDRGPFLEVDDGPLWRLQADEDLASHQDKPVRIEAWQRGASLLELLWIGPA